MFRKMKIHLYALILGRCEEMLKLAVVSLCPYVSKPKITDVLTLNIQRNTGSLYTRPINNINPSDVYWTVHHCDS